MERQIDEMAKHCTYYSKGECYVDVLYPGECDLMCEVFGLLTNLEKAGYRKASDVAREIFAEIDVLVDDWKYSRIQSIQFIAELAELKKKYESEDTE